jgi:hypothetical protein
MLHWLRKYKTLFAAPVLTILVLASFAVLGQQCLIKNIPQSKAQVKELASSIKQNSNHSESQKKSGHECCSNAQSEETINHLCCDLDQIDIDNIVVLSNNGDEITLPFALLIEHEFKLISSAQTEYRKFSYHPTILTHQKSIARNIVLLN